MSLSDKFPMMFCIKIPHQATLEHAHCPEPLHLWFILCFPIPSHNLSIPLIRITFNPFYSITISYNLANFHLPYLSTLCHLRIQMDLPVGEKILSAVTNKYLKTTGGKKVHTNSRKHLSCCVKTGENNRFQHKNSKF